jgi:hypothetical protein
MSASRLLVHSQRLLRDPHLRWVHDMQLWVELFATSNLAILAADIYIAHSTNQFRNPAEYIPFYFSLGAPVALAAGIVARWIVHAVAPWRIAGFVVGWLAILTGLAGVLYHLESSFFLERTIRSLTYAAPFAAPLAYTGLGFLLLMNRMVDSRSPEWSRWVLLLALGGFLGNFILSLTDHAENGFFAGTEWIPVCSSALATGFLLVPLIAPVTRRFLDACCIVMLLQAAAGVLGFWFHLQANLVEPGHSLFERLVNGAPPFAPLLFPNLVVLAWIGLWALTPHLPEDEESTPHHSVIGAVYAWAAPSEIEAAR